MRAVEVRVTGDADSANRALRGTESDLRALDKTARTTDRGMKGIGGTLAKIGGALLAAGALRKGVGLLRESVGLASDLAETSSKVGVVFGKNAAGITKWAANSNAALVSTEKSVLDVVSGFNILLGNKGVNGQQGRKMSKTLTNLSADLASFFNTDVAQASNALTSALKGEMDPLEAFGVSLDDATLKARALAMGLYSGKGPLDQQAKAMAAYEEILRQTSKAQGDLERTQGSTANLTKQFTTNLTELKTTAGTAFTPLIDKYLPGINKWLEGLNSQDGAKRLGEQLVTIGDRAAEVWPTIQGFFSDVKASFQDVPKEEITGTLGAIGDAAQTMGGFVKGAFDAFNGLSPEAKKNILLLVAAGAAIGLAKKNPVVKIGVDLVAGTIQSMAETMASAIATRMFSGAFAQRVAVINWPPGAFSGGGGTGVLGGGGGKVGAFLGWAAAASVIIAAGDALWGWAEKQPEAQSRMDDYLKDLKRADASISGVLADQSEAYASLITDEWLARAKGDSALQQAQETAWLARARGDAVLGKAQEAEWKSRARGDADNARTIDRGLADQRREAAKEAEAIRKESITRDRALAKAIKEHWEDINKLFAEGRGTGQNNPSITGRTAPSAVVVNNYYPEPERASDSLAMSLRVARNQVRAA